jgi:4-amino-4-deoxy-L-arabinose transferase-like glycosyltransferase
VASSVSFRDQSGQSGRSTLALAAASAVLLLWRLGASSLEDWDEAIYAEVGREMAVSGEWLTPHWHFQPWFEKPPLVMWAMAVGFRLFGVTEFWARFPAALAGIGLVLLTAAIARRTSDLQDSTRAAVFSSAILLSTFHFVFLARRGMTDVPFCLFSWLAAYAYLRVREGQPKWWLLAGGSAGLAFLAKGVAAVLVPAAIGVALLIEREWKAALGSRHFWWGAAFFAGIALPWPALMWLRHGPEFPAEFIGYHIVTRALTPLEGTRPEEFYYLKAIVRGAFPWSLLFPFAILFGLREARRNPAYRLLLLIPAVVFAAHFPARTQGWWYLLPAIPALAILTAGLVGNAWEKFANLRRAIPLAFGAAAGLVLFVFLQPAAVPAAEVYLRWRPMYAEWESPVAQLARTAGQDAPDGEPLILCSDEMVLSLSTAIFYSGRPVEHTYIRRRPVTAAKRYYAVRKLPDVAGTEARQAIVSKELLPVLAAEYEVTPVRETEFLVYAVLKRRPQE